MIKYLCALIFCFMICVSAVSAQTWTWPGDLKTHLANEHSIFVSDMSHADMVQIHNELHNGTFDTHFVDENTEASMDLPPPSIMESQEIQPMVGSPVATVATGPVIYMYNGDGPIRRLVRRAGFRDGPVRRMVRQVFANGPVRRLFRGLFNRRSRLVSMSFGGSCPNCN